MNIMMSRGRGEKQLDHQMIFAAIGTLAGIVVAVIHQYGWEGIAACTLTGTAIGALAGGLDYELMARKTLGI